MTKDYHLTQDEAERLAKDCGALIHTFGGPPFSDTVFSFEFRSPEQLQAYINAALDKVLGEHVAEVIDAYNDGSIRTLDWDYEDIKNLPKETKLYAPKGLT